MAWRGFSLVTRAKTVLVTSGRRRGPWEVEEEDTGRVMVMLMSGCRCGIPAMEAVMIVEVGLFCVWVWACVPVLEV